MSARRLLITGTDTEVGKTRVGCALAAALREAGWPVRAVKPVESGVMGDVPAEGEDGVLLARAAGQRAPQAALVRLRAPLAPPLAADREGVVLHPEEWIAAIEEVGREADPLLVEGAGGLLSPIAWGFTPLDLGVALRAAALVVAADRLGSINHALLTITVLERAGLGVAAVVFSAPETPDASSGTNAASLRRMRPDLRVHTWPRIANDAEALSLGRGLISVFGDPPAGT